MVCVGLKMVSEDLPQFEIGGLRVFNRDTLKKRVSNMLSYHDAGWMLQ
jgi:hypothetical protein